MRTTPPAHHQRGSGILTLAIALIAAGLTVGGYLMWQSNRISAELRQSIASLEHYQSAMLKFKRQFESLPGDFPYATRIWGSARGALSDGYSADCANLTKPSTDKKTCNGNGDGWPYDSTVITPSQHYERFRFWQHLANGGFIEGQYTGIGGPHDRKTHHVEGVNTPRTPFPDGVFVITSGSKPRWDVNVWSQDGNYVRLEMRNDHHNRLAVLTTRQMAIIDEKMDDGKPGTGKIQSYTPLRQPLCATTKEAATAQYNFTKTELACSVIYYLDK